MQPLFKQDQTLQKGTVDVWHFVSRGAPVGSLRLSAVQKLKRYLFTEEKHLRFETNCFGKPFLTQGSLFFNLSKSKDELLLAVTRDSEVGVDLERIKEIPDLKGLVRVSLNSEEQKSFERRPTLFNFFTAWVRKEALFKAIGSGFAENPENTKGNLLAWDRASSGCVFDELGRAWTICDLSLSSHAIGALAFAGEQPPVIRYFREEIEC